MFGTQSSSVVESIEQLEALYGAPNPKSLTKEIDHISDHYRAFIDNAPFLLMATCAPEGLDCSPRGDPRGFVRVVDRHTLLIPDRPGNNRLDSLKNVVRDPRIALLFLIPGIGETLRVNGKARVLVDAELCASFSLRGKAAKAVIEVTVERVYFQCQKALARSRLWEADAQVDRRDLPSAGEILAALSDDGFDGEQYDQDYPERMKQTMY